MLIPFYNDFRPDPSEVSHSEDRESLLKIETCRERRGLTKCSQCLYFNDCELLKAHLRRVAFGADSETGSNE